MKRFIAAVAVATSLGLMVMAGGWFWIQSQIQAPGPLARNTVLVIEPGAGLNRIASQLERHGVIQSALVFRLHTRLAGYAGQLKAGEYQFTAAATAGDVLAKLVANDVVIRFITVPEGLTSAQIIAMIDGADGLAGETPRNIEEGSLLPETYGYSRGETRTALIRRMSDSLDRTVRDLWLDRQEGLPFDSPDEAIILASIVEKEAAVASERSRVAAVFVNRLKRGMRLQSDPTVAFGIDPVGPLGRSLRRSDLERDTPYNTYRIDGLPPGPICHPGRDSLLAVLNPAPTQDLYFVADGTGGHAFAQTLPDHNRNVARWRRIQRERGER